MILSGGNGTTGSTTSSARGAGSTLQEIPSSYLQVRMGGAAVQSTGMETTASITDGPGYWASPYISNSDKAPTMESADEIDKLNTATSFKK